MASPFEVPFKFPPSEGKAREGNGRQGEGRGKGGNGREGTIGALIPSKVGAIFLTQIGIILFI